MINSSARSFVVPRCAALVALVGCSLAACGSSSQTTDGAASGTGGKQDGGAASGTGGKHDGGAAGANGGHVGTGGAAGRATTGGTTGTAGSGAGGAGTVGFADIGKLCGTNADCASGLTCLTAGGTSIAGTEGPANGYCSKMCSNDTDCGGVGTCLDVSATGATPVGYCFQSCTFGGADPTKCHSRPDVGCLTLDATTTPTTDVCFPVCSQDADCPSGRKCNLADNLCADTPAAGDPLGTHCALDPDSGTSNCQGGCLPIGAVDGGTAVASFCSTLCVVGLDACNWVGAGTSLTSGGAHGVCAPASKTAQRGDVGVCVQECDTAASCTDQSDPGLTCDTSAMSTIGHGVCSWN